MCKQINRILFGFFYSTEKVCTELQRVNILIPVADSTSQSLANEIESKVVPSLKDFVKVGAINIDTEKALATEFQVSTTPKIIFYSEVEGIRDSFDQSTNTKDIVEWTFNQIPNYVQGISSHNVKKFLKKNPKLPKFILFTQKSRATALYKILSRNFQDTCDFGLAFHTDKELVRDFGLEGSTFPTLLAHLPFDSQADIVHPEEWEKFTSDFQFSKIKSFVSEFALNKRKKPKTTPSNQQDEAVSLPPSLGPSSSCGQNRGYCFLWIGMNPESSPPPFLTKISPKIPIFDISWTTIQQQPQFVDTLTATIEKLKENFDRKSNLWVMINVKKSKIIVQEQIQKEEDLLEFLEKIRDGQVKWDTVEISRIFSLLVQKRA
jgi:hypothetical protein